MHIVYTTGFVYVKCKRTFIYQQLEERETAARTQFHVLNNNLCKRKLFRAALDAGAFCWESWKLRLGAPELGFELWADLVEARSRII